MSIKLKKIVLYISCALIMGLFATNMSSCKAGYGCPAEEAYEKSKDQPLSNKRGKSNLFSKKQRKKMKSRNK